MIFFLHNLFLGNSLDENVFGGKLFLVENVFVAKSFPRKVLMKKILVEIFFLSKIVFARNFFYFAKSFPRKKFG
jgi:hypothetical protein